MYRRDIDDTGAHELGRHKDGRIERYHAALRRDKVSAHLSRADKGYGLVWRANPFGVHIHSIGGLSVNE